MLVKSFCALPLFVLVAGVALADRYPGTIVERLDAAGDYAARNDFRAKALGSEINERPADLKRDSDTDLQNLTLQLAVYGEGRP